MSFVERVVGHVRRVQQIADGATRDKRVVIDYGRHEACSIALLDRASASDGESWPRLTGRLEWFVEELHWVLLAGAAAELGLDERSSLVDLGIALAARVPHDPPLGPPWLTPARRRWLVGKSEDLWFESGIWFDGFVSTTWPRVPRYCAEIGLVEEDQGQWHVTRAGELLSRLRGRDAVTWLLTLETQMAVASLDLWRVDGELVSELLTHRTVPEVAPSDPHADARRSHMERLSAMGLLDVIEDAEGRREGWRLTELGETVLEEVKKGAEGPMGVLARAIWEDEIMAVVESKTKAPVRIGDHVETTVLHARMVAHEVRNALGPVQHASRALRAAVGGTAAGTPIIEQIETIDQGVERLYRFVTEAVRLVPPEAMSFEPFSILEAITEARKELPAEGLGSLTIETLPVSADPRCQGSRGQFAMAMLNVLRNAQQAAGAAVQVIIRVDARNPEKVLLSIEDDGPGVPDAVREHIFENGVSYREHGTGHGLASLRAVVEDMGGKVRCTTSELGGARFEIVLPVAEVSP